MGGYATAESLEWGDNSSEILKEEFNMIVLADCVYYEEVPTFIIIPLAFLFYWTHNILLQPFGKTFLFFFEILINFCQIFFRK